jgi:flagellar hook protein FlgE
MQVVGDNIANVNTMAYKSNRSLFGDILSLSIEGGAFRKLGMGRGVQLLGTSPLWSQGSLETTGRSTDLAISGRGFFIVQEKKEHGAGGTYYTRAGSFSFDKNGYLTNSDGLVLQGYKVDETTGSLIRTLTDVYIPSGASPPKVTTSMMTHLNLNADSSGGTQARVTVDGGWTAATDYNNDITFTWVATGEAGNDATVKLEDDSTATTPLVSVTGNEITVKFKAGSATAKEIADAVNDSPYASKLIKATVEGDGSGTVYDAATGGAGSSKAYTLAGGGEPIAAVLNAITGTDESTGVRFTAVTPGAEGNQITVEYRDPGTASASLNVEVVDQAIIVHLATDATGAITSKASDIVAAIAASTEASELVTATLMAPDSTGSGTVAARSAVSLSGGLESYPDTYTNTITVYDSLGNPIEVTIKFTCREPARWSWEASIPSELGSTASTGTIKFDSEGNLDVAQSGGGNPVVTLNLINGATTPLNIEWQMLDSTGKTNGTITGYGIPSALTFQNQDGYAAGMITSVSVDEIGVVSGVYSNGRLVPLYQVALADFPSYAGMDRIGKNLYAESINSGEATVGTPDSGVLGRINPSALEMSNVDLGEEFVKMITTQRAFQANSRVITTSDEILQELMNIKR